MAYGVIERRNAVAEFESALAAVRPGEVLDVRSAFPLAWDRVVIVGPYAPGYAANALLGFHHYSDDETFISGDSGQFIIFVNGGKVVADLRNWGPTWFDEEIQVFGREAATFVRTSDGFLLPASN